MVRKITSDELVYLVTIVTMKWRGEESKTVKQIYACKGFSGLLRGIADNMPGLIETVTIELINGNVYQETDNEHSE